MFYTVLRSPKQTLCKEEDTGTYNNHPHPVSRASALSTNTLCPTGKFLTRKQRWNSCSWTLYICDKHITIVITLNTALCHIFHILRIGHPVSRASALSTNTLCPTGKFLTRKQRWKFLLLDTVHLRQTHYNCNYIKHCFMPYFSHPSDWSR